ncbi:M28 family peptidase [Sphingomonas lutea]|uniref:Vacuolar membrane protease n=1 Tax=Sphingomonas lutea TaxID=1045317 RepID=A0A7G9SFA3_9SPHN|nr:M28 family peptidase [Sphingomonas lutea]QNN66528.1 M28 family peptidase [Sphingomonas lutea]
MRKPILLLAVLVTILAAMGLRSQLTAIPAARSQSAPTQFDANRAHARLAVVLREQVPHPADTAANDVVRARLIAQLRGMGLSPIVRDQRACNELYKSRGVSCARVRNVIATVGPATGKALLLSAHYDSTPTGPGAGDAGIGVATLLEVAALTKDRPLQRPIIFLFNEGEELGLIGARAFLDDPLSRNVDSLVNLEARGVRGPVNMFETSRPNAAAIAVFKRAAANPVANSLSTDVYRLMPNYTDVNTLAERGWLTLNLAPIGNETRYHSPGDDLAALDRATLQHMGDQTLALVAELDPGVPKAQADWIFMDLGGRYLFTLPLAVGLLVLAALLLAVARVSWARGGLARTGAVVIGTLLLSTGLTWLMLALLGAARPGHFWRAHPMWTHLAISATVALVAVVLLATVGRRVDRTHLRPLFWLVFLILGAIIAIAAPGGVVFFLLPPTLLLIGMFARRWWPRAEQAGALAAVVALYLTWGAMLGLLEELLNAGPLWVFAPLGVLIILPALIEAKPLIVRPMRRVAGLVAMSPMILLWAMVAAVPAYSADRQQRFVIEHVTDATTGKAYWSILNGKAPLPHAYREMADWRWAALPTAEAKRWVAAAPRAPGIAAPTAQVVSTVANGRERAVTARLRANGSTRLTLIGPKDARIRAAGTAGFVRPIDAAAEEGEYLISCFGRSCDGAELHIRIDRAEPVTFKLVGMRAGLPVSAAPLLDAKPRFARPQYAPNQTLVVSRVRI